MILKMQLERYSSKYINTNDSLIQIPFGGGGGVWVGVGVAQSLFVQCIVGHCLCFCHCILWLSINGFRISLGYLQTFLNKKVFLA